MKTHQLKAMDSPLPKIKRKVAVDVKTVEREPPIWLQVVVADIKELFLLTKEAVPRADKPKPESIDDWKEYFRR
jgi:hypothetical protein